MRRYNDLYLDARQALRTAGSPMPSLEARELIRSAAGKSPEELIGSLSFYAPDETVRLVDEYLSRRLGGEPTAYITGQWMFYGLELDITPDVLIPRTDTEILAEAAIEHARGLPEGSRILDLCTGGGCIGIAVAVNAPGPRVTFCDISGPALDICKRNMLRHKINGTRVSADALKPAPVNFGQFDLLICNPPYINARDMDALDPSVAEFEPRLALYGGEDGLDFYRSAAENWKSAIKPGGAVMLECGYDQSVAVAEILRAGGFIDITAIKDSQDIERVVTAAKPVR